MRYIGLDIGDKRIGIAVSDFTGTIANPLCVYERIGYSKDVLFLEKVKQEQQAVAFVSGLPKNMDGSVGFQAQKVLDFCEQLTKKGHEVFFQDERLSTVSAHSALIEGNMRREDRKKTVDKVAAAVILQSYLDYKKNNG